MVSPVNQKIQNAYETISYGIKATIVIGGALAIGIPSSIALSIIALPFNLISQPIHLIRRKLNQCDINYLKSELTEERTKLIESVVKNLPKGEDRENSFRERFGKKSSQEKIEFVRAFSIQQILENCENKDRKIVEDMKLSASLFIPIINLVAIITRVMGLHNMDAFDPETELYQESLPRLILRNKDEFFPIDKNYDCSNPDHTRPVEIIEYINKNDFSFLKYQYVHEWIFQKKEV